jgi:hypothetical protein
VRIAPAGCTAVAAALIAIVLLRLRRRLTTRTPAHRGPVIPANRLAVTASVLTVAGLWESAAVLRHLLTGYEPTTLALH